MYEYDIVIIGGGVGGISAAIKAKSDGTENILILEREESLGGIINQYIHSGFGRGIFEEELTGPEYAERLISKLKKLNIEYKLNTTVFEFNKNKIVSAVNEEEGIINIKAKSVIFATGAKERPRGVINVAGSKCAGIYTTGMVQKFINVEGYLPGKEVVILGSYNNALIIARRLKLEGANVKAIVDSNLKLQGSPKYIEECINDFNIPLKLGYIPLNIKGKERVEGIKICRVDNEKEIIKDTQEYIECNTIVLSVSLSPESRLLESAGARISEITLGPEVNEYMETNLDGVFACGNLVRIHDDIEYITTEGFKTGENCAKYLKNL